MTDLLFLAVEEAVPADHPAAWLAVPLGLLFFSGSVYLLLWSNYGARKAGAIYGTAFFGITFLLGMFWWFGAPGIPPGLGISHLPGERSADRASGWYAFEEGSERAGFFPGHTDLDAFVTAEEFTGVAGEDIETIEADPAFGTLAGEVGVAEQRMQELFLPVDENNVAQIGAERRAALEEDAAAQQPEDAVGRAQPFFSAMPEEGARVREDPETGLLLATQPVQAYATFTDEEGVPFDPVPVGEPQQMFAFQDPGTEWVPSMVWTLISLGGLLLSLLWLDRLELREKRLASVEVEEPERIAEPIAQ